MRHLNLVWIVVVLSLIPIALVLLSDYSDLTDDYVKKPVAKRLNIVGKYFEKLFFPTCAVGMILIIIGAFRDY